MYCHLFKPPRDLRKPVVQRAANDGEQPRAAEPPALPQRLLRLCVIPADDAHERRGDDAFHEAQEETLREGPRHDVTAAVSMQMADQRMTTQPRTRPTLKRCSAKVMGYRPASMPK